MYLSPCHETKLTCHYFFIILQYKEQIVAAFPEFYMEKNVLKFHGCLALDTEVLGDGCTGCAALRSENEMLKLQLFWTKHTTTKLKDAMIWANQKSDGVNCNCHACAVSGRKDSDNGLTASAYNCLFKPYFEALLTECGLCVGSCNGETSNAFEHFSDDSGNSVDNSDSHLVTIGRDDWVAFTYGAKLWREPRSEKDAELQKLKLLFELLNREL